MKSSAEAEHESEVIWLKVRVALCNNAGTLYESTRVPSTLEGQGII